MGGGGGGWVTCEEIKLAEVRAEPGNILLRGGIKIRNQENLGQCLNRGGVEINRNVPISIWEFENRGGGSLFFKNVPISII